MFDGDRLVGEEDNSSVTLVDYRIGESTLSLNSRADNPSFIVSFLEYCRLIEALVLNESPVLLTNDRTDQAARESSLTAPFIDAGVLRLSRSVHELPDPATDPQPTGSLISHNITTIMQALSLTYYNGCGYVPPVVGLYGAVQQLLELSIESDLPIQYPWEPNPRQTTELEREVLKRLLLIRSSQQSSDLINRSYRDLTRGIDERLGALRAKGRPVPIFIPPIAAIVMSDARNQDSVGRVALDFRDNLAPHRKAFTEYERVIRDDDVPIEDSVRAAERLQRSLDSLITEKHSRELLAISDWRDVVGAGAGVAEGATKGGVLGVLGSLLGKPLQAVDRALQRREVMYMTVISDRFMKIRGYGRLVEKIFGVSPTENEYERTFERISYLTTSRLGE